MKKLIVFFTMLSAAFSYGQTITTICGNGDIGQVPLSGQVATTINCYPLSIAVDTARNVYYVDAVTNTVCEVVAATGKFLSVAGQFIGSGQPQQGFAGDGQNARYALFRNPQGIAVDDSLNIYIADEYNYRVRKVSHLTGVITTIAGTGVSGFSGDSGLAINAQLGSPYALAVDDSFMVYINDQLNNRIRKINVKNGKIYTIAGNGITGFAGDGQRADSAQFNQPQGICVDDSFNVYIADRNNQRIRKFNRVSNKMSTIAGNGTAGFTGDGGAATSARLNYPVAVTADDSFAIYIADQQNDRVRKVKKSTQVITTVAGSGLARNNGDTGLPVNAGLNLPFGVAVDKQYNYYIAVNHYRIRKATNH